MTLFRISNHTDLSGLGGELADGRWHTRRRGKRIVYLSDHPALCVLEMLVHVPREADMTEAPQMLALDIPDRLVHRLDFAALPADWRARPGLSQELGNQWLAARRSVGLLVPSVLVPRGFNCLFNPAATGAATLTADALGPFPLDPRLRHP